MGFLLLVSSRRRVELPDVVLANALDAVQLAFLRRGLVSVCFWEGDQGGYVQVDASRAVDPNERISNGRQGEYGLAATAVYAGDSDEAEAAIDEIFVEKLADLMEKTGGCLVISRDQELVSDLDTARHILRGATRISRPILDHPGV
ncbi:hypothetical protein H7347_06945 [Corynebacterium sp. zg-331]|uniref:hypothetical protein n=1 Tax=unclassified Corynebacterium TaxID=2624378 RepID=UPI00128D3467|nr:MULTISPECIES: hypothetical protein [unclassified Corynebacterium]MBC3186309.1 hypothetical protein [Corynebacterium sp. zg-331]MPV52797.1 hypothetical protein [Corynebacterium sp. zg331]